MRSLLLGLLTALAAVGLLPLTGCVEGNGNVFTEAIVYMSESPFTQNQVRVSTPWVWLMTADGLATVPVLDFTSTRPIMGSLSPDGARIVYVDRDNRNVIIYDLATATPTAIYTGDDPRTPAWSPDGGAIVFSDTASASGGESIYTMDADGGNVTELLAATQSNRFVVPKYNRTGTKIVFVDGPEGGALSIMDADGTNAEVLNDEVSCLHPSFLPDGRILYVQWGGGWGDEVWIVDVDGSNARSLTGPIPALDGVSEYHPTCNDAGTAIAFGVGNQSSGDIYVTPFNGTDLGTPVNVTAEIDAPCWRPDFGRVRTDLLDTVFNPIL
ncbi:MAG: TolB family protein [Armatimonadota bacterium]